MQVVAPLSSSWVSSFTFTAMVRQSAHGYAYIFLSTPGSSASIRKSFPILNIQLEGIPSKLLKDSCLRRNRPAYRVFVMLLTKLSDLRLNGINLSYLLSFVGLIFC